MASKRRVRMKQCGGKKRHDTESLAWSAAMAATRAGVTNGGTLRAYRCRWCGKFHWGHRSRF